MLTHIAIKNFAVIDDLSLTLQANMTVITGETGAGKSIMVDAMALALGQRASSNVLAVNNKPASIVLIFDATGFDWLLQWLQQQGYYQNHSSCTIRRVFNPNSASKCFINDTPVTLQKLKILGQKLINIHSQHQHQLLFQLATQRLLLDAFAKNHPLVKEIEHTYHQWKKAKRDLQKLEASEQDDQAKIAWLDYQLQELSALNFKNHDLALEQEHQKLATVNDSIATCQQALMAISEGENAALTLLSHAKGQLTALPHLQSSLKNSIDSLQQAIIHCQDSGDELRHFAYHLESNPKRLAEIEQRLSHMDEITRKHQITADKLPALQQGFEKDYQALIDRKQQLVQLQRTLAQLTTNYKNLAAKLSCSRKQAAMELGALVTKHLAFIGMPQAKFEVALTPCKDFTCYGAEKVEFLINTHLKQAPQPLVKVASGGELSRISLAIEVICLAQYSIPTLIFDEIDVGIGGAVAEMVGKLLSKLAQNAQVIVITHLAQVAAKGRQHITIRKANDGLTTDIKALVLDQKQRIKEIARMIGGIKITPQTLAYAKEMLK